MKASMTTLRGLLPDGRGLAPEVWGRRHRVILVILWLHVGALAIYGTIRGYGALHSCLEASGLAVLAVGATQGRGGQRLRSTIASGGLMTASALAVHFSAGSIEAHFHFFVMIAVLSLYQDWIPFLVALAFVVIHHGLAGYLHPQDVYDHTDAVEHPWRWAVIHGAFVLAAAAAQTYGWRASEDDHRRAAEAMRRSEETFRTLFEQNPQPTWVFDPESFRFLAVNAAATVQYGYSEAEFLAMRVTDVRPPDQVPEFLAGVAGRVEGPAGTWVHRTRSGRDFPVAVYSRTLDFHERPARISVMFDLSERLALEDELRRRAEELASSNRELEQFAYVSAHDLQEPLRMVASYVQLLERRYHGRLGADADDYIGFAVEGATRMQSLITDLLSYSRVGRGPDRAELDLVDVRACVTAATRNLEASIQANRAEIICRCRELPVVPGDATQLTQLFQNLIGNAVKFHGKEPPRVELSAEREGSSWILSVADNGIGMEQRHAERIFAVFQRLNPRERYPGTGIGLAICKKIVERHHGRIWVESRPGRGSVFRVALPAELAAVA